MPHPRARTPDLGTINFTILEEGLHGPCVVTVFEISNSIRFEIVWVYQVSGGMLFMTRIASLHTSLFSVYRLNTALVSMKCKCHVFALITVLNKYVIF